MQAEALLALSFTPDGKNILTKDGQVTQAGDADAGKALGVVSVKLPASPGSPTILSPDGRVGVTVAKFSSPTKAKAAKVRDAVLFDSATGQELGTIGLEVDNAPIHRKPL